jgi:hypothetical protein
MGVLAIASVASANLVVNGDFSAGADGWTPWGSTWGTGVWSIEDGKARITGTGSRGLLQAIPTVPGNSYTITADWAVTGNLHWGEILFFNDDGRAMMTQLDGSGMVQGSIITKVDGWGMNGQTTPGFPALVPAMTEAYWFPGGNFTNTVVATGDHMIVSIKAGTAEGNVDYWADNIVVTPEPVTALLIGVSMLLVRRRRA